MRAAAFAGTNGAWVFPFKKMIDLSLSSLDSLDFFFCNSSNATQISFTAWAKYLTVLPWHRADNLLFDSLVNAWMSTGATKALWWWENKGAKWEDNML